MTVVMTNRIDELVAAYEAKITTLTAERDRMREALNECEEYFDNKADADCDQDGFIPNKEMRLLSAVQTALLTRDEQKAQDKRCGCGGSDDYCVCQNSPDKTTIAARQAIGDSHE